MADQARPEELVRSFLPAPAQPAMTLAQILQMSAAARAGQAANPAATAAPIQHRDPNLDPAYRAMLIQQAAAKLGLSPDKLGTFAKSESTSVGDHPGLTSLDAAQRARDYASLPLLGLYNEMQAVRQPDGSVREVPTGVLRRRVGVDVSRSAADPEVKETGFLTPELRAVGNSIAAAGRDGLGLLGRMGLASNAAVQANADQAEIDRLDASRGGAIGSAIGTLAAAAPLAAAGAFAAPEVAGAAGLGEAGTLAARLLGSSALGMGAPSAGEAANTATAKGASATTAMKDAAVGGIANTALGLITGGTAPAAVRRVLQALPASARSRLAGEIYGTEDALRAHATALRDVNDATADLEAASRSGNAEEISAAKTRLSKATDAANAAAPSSTLLGKALSPTAVGAIATGLGLGAGGAAVQGLQHAVDPSNMDGPTAGGTLANMLMGAAFGGLENRVPTFARPDVAPTPYWKSQPGNPFGPEAPAPRLPFGPNPPDPVAAGIPAGSTRPDLFGFDPEGETNAANDRQQTEPPQTPTSLTDWFGSSLPQDGIANTNDGGANVSTTDLASLLDGNDTATPEVIPQAGPTPPSIMSPDMQRQLEDWLERGGSPEAANTNGAAPTEDAPDATAPAAATAPSDEDLRAQQADAVRQMEEARQHQDDMNAIVSRLTPDEAVQTMTMLRNSNRTMREAIANGGVTARQTRIDPAEAAHQIAANTRMIEAIQQHMERLSDRIDAEGTPATADTPRSYVKPSQLTFDDLLAAPEERTPPKEQGTPSASGPLTRTVRLSRRTLSALDTVRRVPALDIPSKRIAPKAMATAAMRGAAAYGRAAEEVRQALRGGGHSLAGTPRVRPLARVSAKDLQGLAESRNDSVRYVAKVEMAYRNIEDFHDPVTRRFMRQTLAQIPGLSDADLGRVRSTGVAEGGDAPFDRVVAAATEQEQYRRKRGDAIGEPVKRPDDINYVDCE